LVVISTLCPASFAEIPECELRSTAAATIYLVAIYAHEAGPGMRYTYQTPVMVLEPGYVARPCPCEGYPIGFEWHMVPPEFEKSTPVLVKSCGDTSRVYPFIFKDGFDGGDTSQWSKEVEMDPETAAAMDRWITGNYGEDHPDNQPRRCPYCEEEIHEDAEQCPYCEEDITDE
jgi:hypothetical protein